MLLARPEKVLELLGVGTSTTTLSNVGTAIAVASRRIEQLIDTEFEFKNKTDYFQTSGLPFKHDIGTLQQFRLSSGYVQPIGLTVRYAEVNAPLFLSISGTVLAATQYMVDYVKGTVACFTALNLGYSTLSVTYDSGFDADPSDEGQLLDLPAWVGDAAAALSVYILKILPSNPANRTSIKGQVVLRNDRLVVQYAESLVAPYIRPRGNLEFASRTVVNEP